MATLIHNINFDAHDHYRQARWWEQVLDGYGDDPDDPNHPEDPASRIIGPAGSPGIYFENVPDGKTVKNRVHLDLQPVGRTRDEEVERLLALGATLYEDHRRPDGTGWVTLTDPEGNEFCVERSAAERAATA